MHSKQIIILSSRKAYMLFVFLLFGFLSFSQTNIFDVCRTGSLEDITKLYNQDNGVVNKINDNGYSALTLACYSKNVEVVSFLVDKVKDINGNSKYGTPLMAAVYKKNKDIVKLLLEHNADTDIQDMQGVTASHFAVMFKSYDIIQLLVDYKADFNIKGINEKSAIDYAIMYNDEKINDILKN